MNVTQNEVFNNSVLRNLSYSLANGVQPLQWWGWQISPLKPEVRRNVLNYLASVLARDMRGVSNFAQCFVVSKKKQPIEFECMLFDFLMPLHHALVDKKAWDDALSIETIIYSNFIKQEEDHDFYEKSFASLYSPYYKIFKSPQTRSGEELLQLQVEASYRIYSDNPKPDSPILFWFQNFSMLAHTQLVLDLATYLPSKSSLYASALSNVNLAQSSALFAEAGIDILPIDETRGLVDRCNELVNLCRQKEIRNIIFVSIPLQSGYLKTLANGISLTWWSMKYPLGCMAHFDRLVCNRTLYPKQKLFNGALWHCSPFAVKSVVPVELASTYLSNDDELKIGVLSREEKFASSQLPEVLNRSLVSNPKSRLFWTGRQRNVDLDSRLHGRATEQLADRINFCGWVEPLAFLKQIDLLIDTPNLGGMVAYWMMSMGKVVMSATEFGSIGALGSRTELEKHLDLLSTTDEIDRYFSSSSDRPYYLSDVHLTSLCIAKYCEEKDLLREHGRRFLCFFNDVLSDMERWSQITYEHLQGRF